MTITKRGVSALLALLIPLVAFAPLAGSAGPILGAAQRFTVPSASTAANTGSTKVKGDLGLSPGPKVSGFFGTAANEGPRKLVTGATHETDAVAAQAQNDALVAAQSQNDMLIAANVLLGLPFTNNLTGQDLGGLTLTPGGYSSSSGGQLREALTLDAQGRHNADFVQIGKTRTTASKSTVGVINDGAGDGVYWDVGSSATLGSSTLLADDIVAEQSTTLDAAVQILCGRASAPNTAVTMDTNVVSGDCTASDSWSESPIDLGSLGFSGANSDGQSRSVPEPSSCLLLLAAGLVGVGARMRGTLRASFESASLCPQ